MPGFLWPEHAPQAGGEKVDTAFDDKLYGSTESRLTESQSGHRLFQKRLFIFRD